MKGPTIEEINSLRESTGEGLMECRRILAEKYKKEEKQELIKAVQEIKWMLQYGETRDILEEVIDVLDKVVQRI